MAFSCASVCFGLFLTVSSALHLGEMALNGIFVYSLYFNETQKTWFLPCIGLLLLPMVSVQLVSAVLLLMKKAEKLSVCSSVCTAVLHIFQLGFLWRHIVLFREKDTESRSNDLTDLILLQVLHTFTSMLPLLLLQSFLLLHHQLNDWLIVATILVTLAGSCWSLASFRRQTNIQKEPIVLTWPGTVFRFMWRLGEIVSRVISLTVFATVYYYWIFLILGLHGITMLVCLCTSVLGMFERPDTSRSYKAFMGIILAYMYSFCFINLSSSSTTFRYILFYVIMFFENLVLTAVWYLSNSQSNSKNEEDTIVFISAGSFFIAIVSMVMYYKFFHISASMDFEKQHICEPDGCINCKLSLCSKHNIKLQRPFSAGWISQYQQALSTGNYYKNILQDPLLDSEWESSPEILNSSGEHWQIRDTDLESIRTNEKPKFTSVQASGTYTHKRFFNSDPNIAVCGDTDSITSGSGVYEDDWRQTTPENLLLQLSSHDSFSMLSSRTQLLTDSWDNLKTSQETLGQDTKSPKKIDILNSLIRKDLDTSFFSDGYTTDHTLDSYQLPITVLAKRRNKLAPRKVETAYSTASDSTDCTICAFMKHNMSSPDTPRRGIRVHENIPEEYHSVHNKRRPAHSRASKVRSEQKQRSKSSDSRLKVLDRPTLSENKHRQHYEKRSQSSSVRSDNSSHRHKYMYTTSNKTVSRKSKTLNQNNTVIPNAIPLQSKLVNSPHKSAFKKFVTDPRSFGESPIPCASDSGDSAFPRHTPLSAYLAAADNDHDGNSESSCEMII